MRYLGYLRVRWFLIGYAAGALLAWWEAISPETFPGATTTPHLKLAAAVLCLGTAGVSWWLDRKSQENGVV